MIDKAVVVTTTRSSGKMRVVASMILRKVAIKVVD